MTARPAFIAELLEAAEKASKGEWKVSDKVSRLGKDRYLTIVSPEIRLIAHVLEGCEKSEDDAAYIALANPANILELARYIEELEAARDAARDNAIIDAQAAILNNCSACGGTGHQDQSEDQCEYCGRPMAAVEAIRAAALGEKP